MCVWWLLSHLAVTPHITQPAFRLRKKWRMSSWCPNKDALETVGGPEEVTTRINASIYERWWYIPLGVTGRNEWKVHLKHRKSNVFSICGGLRKSWIYSGHNKPVILQRRCWKCVKMAQIVRFQSMCVRVCPPVIFIGSVFVPAVI